MSLFLNVSARFNLLESTLDEIDQGDEYDSLTDDERLVVDLYNQGIEPVDSFHAGKHFVFVYDDDAVST